MVLKENKMKKPWKCYFPRLFGTHERIRTSNLSLRSRASGVCTTCYLLPQTLAISHFFQVSLPTICHHFLLITTPFEGPN